MIIQKKILVLSLIFISLSITVVSQPAINTFTQESTHEQNIKTDEAHYSVHIPEDHIDQNQSNNTGEAIKIDSTSKYFAQRFIPHLQILTDISVYLGKKGSFPPDAELTISLRKIIRRPLKEQTITISDIPRNGGWITCNFSYEVLDVNESYYIVIHSDHVNTSQYIEWYFGDENPYLQGDAHFSDDDFEWDFYTHHGPYDFIDFCFRTFGIRNTPPQIPNRPNGPEKGQYGVSYTYSTSTVDREKNTVYYKWSWGDGEQSEWKGPYESEELCQATHSWEIKGSYYIKVKAKDQWGIETDWSDLLMIKMEKTKPHPQIRSYFSKHIDLFTLFQFLIDQT